MRFAHNTCHEGFHSLVVVLTELLPEEAVALLSPALAFQERTVAAPSLDVRNSAHSEVTVHPRVSSQHSQNCTVVWQAC